MLTKVGHARPMLICTDCGLPLDQRESTAMARQRLWGALTLVGLAMASGAMLLLATMYEWRTTAAGEGSLEPTEDASGEGAKKGEAPLLLEPSRLITPPAPRAETVGRAPAAMPSAERTAPATQQQDQQQHPAKHER